MRKRLIKFIAASNELSYGLIRTPELVKLPTKLMMYKKGSHNKWVLKSSKGLMSGR